MELTSPFCPVSGFNSAAKPPRYCPIVESVGSVPALRQDSCTLSGTEALWNAAATTSLAGGGMCCARISTDATSDDLLGGFGVSHPTVSAETTRTTSLAPTKVKGCSPRTSHCQVRGSDSRMQL